jgi:hypothetical protein
MEISSPPDQVARRLVDLETRLRHELSGCAQVKRSLHAGVSQTATQTFFDLSPRYLVLNLIGRW